MSRTLQFFLSAIVGLASLGVGIYFGLSYGESSNRADTRLLELMHPDNYRHQILHILLLFLSFYISSIFSFVFSISFLLGNSLINNLLPFSVIEKKYEFFKDISHFSYE